MKRNVRRLRLRKDTDYVSYISRINYIYSPCEICSKDREASKRQITIVKTQNQEKDTK